MKKVFITDSGKRFTRSRWITIHHACDVTSRHSLYDYATDAHGYHPYQDKFNPENGTYLDYFRYNGRLYALEQFYGIGSMAVGGTPETFIDTDGNLTVIGAVNMDGDLYSPEYAEFDEYCERVRIYEPVKTRRGWI